jgi:hypothetical protein
MFLPSTAIITETSEIYFAKVPLPLVSVLTLFYPIA